MPAAWVATSPATRSPWPLTPLCWPRRPPGRGTGSSSRPADPTPIGLIRISVGLLSTWSLLTLGIDLRSNLGSDGWVNPAALRAFWADWEGAPWVWSLWLWIPDRFLTVAWAVALLILIVFTLGLASRVTAVLAWVIMVSTSRRVPVLYFGFDQAILSWLLYLAFTGSSGQALSLDRLLARRRSRASSGGSARRMARRRRSRPTSPCG